MKKNMGTVDKTVRMIVTGTILALYAFDLVSGTLMNVLLVFSGVMIVTSLFSFCPVYVPLKLSTRPENSTK